MTFLWIAINHLEEEEISAVEEEAEEAVALVGEEEEEVIVVVLEDLDGVEEAQDVEVAVGAGAELEVVQKS